MSIDTEMPQRKSEAPHVEQQQELADSDVLQVAYDTPRAQGSAGIFSSGVSGDFLGVQGSPGKQYWPVFYSVTSTVSSHEYMHGACT